MGVKIHEDPGPSLLFSLEVDTYKFPFMIMCFLTIILFLLLVFNETILRVVTEKLPQSVLLVLFGIAIAGMCKGVVGHFDFILEFTNADIFFKFLLPPIILDSAYQLYCKHFILNLDGIVSLAFIGTILNILAIGGSLYLAYGLYHDHSVSSILMLSTIVAAVDPVAVLAVFNQIGVQRSLYMLIFGESLLNDGVTVVIFGALEKISFSEVTQSTYGYAALSVIPIFLGGSLIGIVYGILSALFCKIASSDSKLFEPTIVIVLAYVAYLNAQLFHWSGIMALITCGLVQQRYAIPGMHKLSKATLEFGIEAVANVAETIIFLLLGFKVLDNNVIWDLPLISLVLFFIVFFRFIFTFFIGVCLNQYRMKKLTASHLFIMAFGGLRGAVSYVMAASLEQIDKNDETIRRYMGCTLAVILVTVLIKGSTIRALVYAMNFQETSSVHQSFTCTLLTKINTYSLAGMETIFGANQSSSVWLSRLKDFDEKRIMPIFSRTQTTSPYEETEIGYRHPSRREKILKRFKDAFDKTDT